MCLIISEAFRGIHMVIDGFFEKLYTNFYQNQVYITGIETNCMFPGK